MKKVRPLLLLIGIAVLITLLVVFTNKRVEEVHNSAYLPEPASDSQIALYVPSPYELSMINADKEIWPRRFSSQQPPRVDDIPTIYFAFLRKNPRERADIDFFRSLAVTASMGEWDAFKDLVGFRLKLNKGAEATPAKLLSWTKAEKCSTYGQEIAYRLAQWDPKLTSDVAKIFSDCDPNSFHTFWFKILKEQDGKNEGDLRKLRDEAQFKRERLSNESYEYFLLTQAFSVLDLKLAHGLKSQNDL